MTPDEKIDLFFSDLSVSTSAQSDSVRVQYQSLPEDYFAFRARHGTGTVGNSEYSIYDEPIPVEKMYGSNCGIAADILVLGDNFSGFSLAWDPGQQCYIVITPEREIWDHTVIAALRRSFFDVMCEELQFLIDRIES